jgi:hypothetical protein
MFIVVRAVSLRGLLIDNHRPAFHSDGKIEKELEGITESDVGNVGCRYPSPRYVRCLRLYQLI